MNDENIFPTDVFVDFHEGLAIRKGRDGTFAEFEPDRRADRFGQREIGRATKDFHRRKALLGKIKTTVSGGRVGRTVAIAFCHASNLKSEAEWGSKDVAPLQKNNGQI